MEKGKIEFLKEDEVHLFYEMMYQSLKTDNVIEEINKSLYLLKACLDSGHIVLHKKIENGRYASYICDATMAESTRTISCIVNKTAVLTENKRFFNIDLNLTKEIKKWNLFILKQMKVNIFYLLIIYLKIR